jgi:hypothetical protein
VYCLPIGDIIYNVYEPRKSLRARAVSIKGLPFHLITWRENANRFLDALAPQRDNPAVLGG